MDPFQKVFGPDLAPKIIIMSVQNSIWLCIFKIMHRDGGRCENKAPGIGLSDLPKSGTGGMPPLPPRFHQPCLIVSKAFPYIQLGIPQTLLLCFPHLFSLSNALHWFGLSAGRLAFRPLSALQSRGHPQMTSWYFVIKIVLTYCVITFEPIKTKTCSEP